MTNYEASKFSAAVVARLRGYIARYDVNQADLAVLCDMSQSQFSKVIRGARPMTIDQMAIIGDALGVDLGELVTEVQTDIWNRDFWTSPVLFVDPQLDERVPPEVRSADKLVDGYATSALRRWKQWTGTEDDSDVPARQEDYDLVANETINEFPDTNDTDYDHA